MQARRATRSLRRNPASGRRPVPLFVAHTVLAIVRERAKKRGVNIDILAPGLISDGERVRLRADIGAAFAIATTQAKRLGYLTETKMTPRGAGKQGAHGRHEDETEQYENLLALARKPPAEAASASARASKRASMSTRTSKPASKWSLR